MSSHTASDSFVPLLESEPKEVVVLKKFLDMNEIKNQLLFSIPMICTSLSFGVIPLVSVMFAGHIGELELAGSNLGNTWATVTGFTFLAGLSGALETLCGQGYGAKLYRMMGIYLQASSIISCFFSILISIFWLYTEPIMILLHQDPQISEKATIYIRYLIPGLFGYGLVQNMIRFLQSQSVAKPLVVCSVVPFIVHIGVTYLLVHKSPLGFEGAALAVSISMWITVLIMGLYVLYGKSLEHRLDGFSLESFNYIVTTLKLALPSTAMMCLEEWAFELLVLLAGLMPNPKITTSLLAMCESTQSISYMVTCGLSAAASTRVSNELGAGNPGKAEHGLVVSLKLSIILAVIIVIVLCFGNNIWAGFFGDSLEIQKNFASMTPLLTITILLDSVQVVLSGVARGCGYQHLAVFANFATFYLIGLPIAVFLGFKLKLHAKGLWMGIICGVFCQTGTLLWIILRIKWAKVELTIKTDEENNLLSTRCPIKKDINNVCYSDNDKSERFERV